jgi:DNA-binding transcriptional MerR regulator
MTSNERIRVEELARRADVSVDTIRFYQKRRLLPAPVREGRVAWYCAEHIERLARIRELQNQGLSLAMIHRLLSGDLDASDARLAAAVADAIVAPEGEPDTDEKRLTLEELAARSGVPAALIEAVAREGLLGPRPEPAAAYTAADAEILAAGLALLEQGLPLPSLLELAREHHAATRAIAERAVQMFDVNVRQPMRAADLAEDEKAARLVEAFRVLLPAVGVLVEHHFRRVLLEVAQEHLEMVGETAEIAAASSERRWRA